LALWRRPFRVIPPAARQHGLAYATIGLVAIIVVLTVAVASAAGAPVSP
jgi:hypothetical protein